MTKFNKWAGKQINYLHVQEQEAVHLLHYLWKMYKAVADEEFVIYIKDMKSQADDGHATYMASS